MLIASIEEYRCDFDGQSPSTDKPDTPPDVNKPPSPPSEFPCSTDPKKPCTEPLGQWHVFKQFFSYPNHIRGQNYPAPANIPWEGARPTTYHYSFPTILEIVDGWHDTSYYKIYVDGKELGEGTDKKDNFRNNAVSCFNGDLCVSMGYGHGYFLIPPGPHSIQVEWAGGPLTNLGGGYWAQNWGYYRVHKACQC